MNGIRVPSADEIFAEWEKTHGLDARPETREFAKRASLVFGGEMSPQDLFDLRQSKIKRPEVGEFKWRRSHRPERFKP